MRYYFWCLDGSENCINDLLVLINLYDLIFFLATTFFAFHTTPAAYVGLFICIHFPGNQFAHTKVNMNGGSR